MSVSVKFGSSNGFVCNLLVVKLRKIIGIITEPERTIPNPLKPSSISRLAAWCNCGSGPGRKRFPKIQK